MCGDDLAAELGLIDAPDTFGSDNLWTYEAGTKNLFGGGKVTLNTPVYLTKWKQIQQSIGLSCSFGFTSNIGSVEIKGFELEGRVEPFRGFEIGGTAAYTDAVVSEAVAGTTARKGDELPNVPKWTATAFAGYSTEFSNGWRFNIRGEYQYQGRAQWTFDPTVFVTFSDGVVGSVPNPSRYRERYQVVNVFESIRFWGYRGEADCQEPVRRQPVVRLRHLLRSRQVVHDPAAHHRLGVAPEFRNPRPWARYLRCACFHFTVTWPRRGGIE